MIDRLTGIVLQKSGEGVVIDVGGVGFRVEVPALSLRALTGEGQKATLFTYLNVKEDALQLYGFATEEEREIFTLLLTVSRVGPKLGLAVLSSFRPAEVVRALVTSDVRGLSSVPGLGRKTAERLVLELKDKVSATWAAAGAMDSATPGAQPDTSWEPDTISLAKLALQELGMSTAEADYALRDASGEEPVPVLVRRALTRRE